MTISPAPGRIKERAALFALPPAVLSLSFSAIFVRLAESPPQELAALRLLLSAAALAALLPIRRAHGRRSGGKAVAGAVVAGVAIGMHYILWFDSLDHTSVASSTLLVTLHPVMVVPLSYLIWRRKASALGAMGILLALAGGALIARGDVDLGAGRLRGDVTAFLSALAMGAYLMIGAAVRKSMELVPYTVVVYAVGGLLALCFAAFSGGGFVWPSSVGAWLPIAGLVFVPTLIGHQLFNWSLKHIHPATVSVSILGEPVGAIVLAAVIFGELPTTWQVAGGITLLLGVYIFAKYPGDMQASGRLEDPD